MGPGVGAGETILVTNSGQPAAVIGPPPEDVFSLLSAQGQVRRVLKSPTTLLSITRRRTTRTTTVSLPMPQRLLVWSFRPQVGSSTRGASPTRTGPNSSDQNSSAANSERSGFDTLLPCGIGNRAKIWWLKLQAAELRGLDRGFYAKRCFQKARNRV